MCRLDGGIDLLDRCEVDLARDLTGGRVVHRPVAPTRADNPLAADPMVDARKVDLGRLG
jgi:hypothetical protein